MVYLFLAATWLAIGFVLIAWHWLHPEIHRLAIWDSKVSLGWLAVALAFYNLVRWYRWRSHERWMRAMQEAKGEAEMRNSEKNAGGLPLDSADPSG